MEGLVEQVRTPERPVYISNINAPLQIVVAGSDAALSAVSTLAMQRGAHRVDRLTVSVPSHCPLLQPVADRLAQAMALLSLRPPAMPYVSNRGGRALRDADGIRDDLATNVAHPVRWYDALEVLRELGATLFLEMAPGHVSTQLVAQLLPGVRAVSIAGQGLRYATVVAARENKSGERPKTAPPSTFNHTSIVARTVRRSSSVLATKRCRMPSARLPTDRTRVTCPPRGRSSIGLAKPFANFPFQGV